MDWSIQDQPARRWLQGYQSLTLTTPQQIKIMTTGPDAQILIQDGPPVGKTWTVTLRVDVGEA